MKSGNYFFESLQSLDSESNKMFFVAVLRKTGVGAPGGVPADDWPTLKACVYKRR